MVNPTCCHDIAISEACPRCEEMLTAFRSIARHIDTRGLPQEKLHLSVSDYQFLKSIKVSDE